MFDSLRLYLRYTGVSIRGQMQYRASFIVMSIGIFFSSLAEFAGIWVLFDRFGQVKGWSLAEAAVFYGMVNAAFAISEGAARGFDVFPSMVKAGDFDRILLRPRSTTLQIMSQDFQMIRIGRFVQGLAVLFWGISALDVTWTPARAGLIAAGILGGACLFSGIFVLQATMAFWTVETLEIVNTVTYGGVEAAQFPLTIYRPWFQRFFTYIIPLACINYFPLLAVLGRSGASGVPLILQWLAPLAGPLFLIVSLQVWKTGVRHYSSTGS